MIAYINSTFQLKWRPEKISGWLSDTHSLLISYETIYLHSWSDNRYVDSSFQHLRRIGKAYQSRNNDKHAEAL